MGVATGAAYQYVNAVNIRTYRLIWDAINSVLMAGHPQRRALLLLSCSLLLILIFHMFFSLAGSAFFSTPYDSFLTDGGRVSHAGVIEDIRETRTGGHMIITVSGVKVFIPGNIRSPDLRIGDEVFVYGILSTFDGDREITIQRQRDIILS